MKIKYTRGDTDPFKFTLKDKDESPVDITGWSFLFTVNKNENPINTADQQFQLVGVIDSGIEGKFSFRPTATDTDIVGFFFYDVQRVDTNGYIKTLAKNEIEFTQDITK